MANRLRRLYASDVRAARTGGAGAEDHDIRHAMPRRVATYYQMRIS
jgi:hypothetical protein